MSKEAEHSDKVTSYYESAQPFYDIFWHKGANGLHYGFWDESTHSRRDAIVKENQILASFAQLKHGDLVLDAGAGISGSGHYLIREFGVKVISLDLVRKQLTKGKDIAGKQRLDRSVDFAQGDYHNLPFKDESFDVIWSLESIEHATDVSRFIHEAFRVLKPGGRIVIAGTFKGKDNLTDDEQRQIEIGMSTAGAFTDFRSAESIAKIMAQEGFMQVANLNKTDAVMESSRQMKGMCKFWMPAAKLAAKTPFLSNVMLLNQQWGIYQEELFKSGATSYNVLVGEKF